MDQKIYDHSIRVSHCEYRSIFLVASHLLFLVITFCGSEFAGDLKGNLTSADIMAVFPGDSDYVGASAACESCLHLVYNNLQSTKK